jgi:hypothetical protein
VNNLDFTLREFAEEGAEERGGVFQSSSLSIG